LIALLQIPANPFADKHKGPFLMEIGLFVTFPLFFTKLEHVFILS